MEKEIKKKKLAKEEKRLRVVVSRSNKNIFAQIVDDASGKTLLGMSTLILKGKKTKKEASFELGELLAKEALRKKIKKVSFDRNGYRYHGRIKALAEGLRKGGLEF